MDSIGLLTDTVYKLKSLLMSLDDLLSVSQIEGLRELGSLITSIVNSQTSSQYAGYCGQSRDTEQSIVDSAASWGEEVIEEVIGEDDMQCQYVVMEIDQPQSVSTIDVKPTEGVLSKCATSMDLALPDHSNKLPVHDGDPLDSETQLDNSEGLQPHSDSECDDAADTTCVVPPLFKYVIAKLVNDEIEAHCYVESMEREEPTVIPDFKLVPPGYQRTWLCGCCDYETTQRSALTRHMVTHMDKEKLSVLCHVCNRICNGKNSLNKHLKRHEEGYQTKYRCTFADCGYTCGSKPNFERHVRRMHTFEMTFKCDDCGKGYPTNVERQEHMRIYHNADFKPKKSKKLKKSPHDKRRYAGGRKVRSSSESVKEMPENLYKCGFCDIGFAATGDLCSHIPNCTMRD